MKKLFGVLLVVALVSASCSSRGEDSSGIQNGSTTPKDAQASAGDWGTLKDVCGTNEGGGKIPEAKEKGDTQGLSEDTIKLGTVADPGFTGRSGLNQELFDSGDAFVKWCNAAGGINGKKLELTKHDSKLTEYKPVMNQACKTDFALVGGGAVQDNLWPQVGPPCNMIDFAGFAVTAAKSGKIGQTPEENNRTVQAVPNTSDTYVIGAALILAKEFPGNQDRLGFVYGDYQTLADEKDKNVEAYEANGFTTVHEAAYSIAGEANWKPFAAAIKADRVDFLKFVGEPVNAGNLDQAYVSIGYTPKVRLFDVNFYDKTYVDTAGAAADGSFISSAFVPLEEAKDNPATQQYLDAIEAVNGKVAVLGLQSMSSWLLFATVAKQCDMDDNLSRTCMLEGATKVTKWTGGGLHAPTDPGTNTQSECVMVMEVVDGKFERHSPKDEGFDCNPAYLWRK